LVKIKNARKLYEFLLQDGIVVRDRSKVKLCEDCLRITIGTETENQKLLERIKEFK
jgi:histidinol-phosphate aminotransferase